MTPQDRLLILAPHPDDEVLCCGGLLQQAVAMQRPVRVGAFTQAVYDQQRPLSPGTVQVRRRSNQLTIRMPLASLGDPDKVLTGARTFLGEIPLDWSSWRVLDLTSEGLSS